MKFGGFFLWFTFLGATAFAQLSNKTVHDLKRHVSYLSDDRLEGRLTGSKGEMLAAEYLIKHFTKIKLKPLGNNNSFLQPFSFTAKTTPSEACNLVINKTHQLKLWHDFFPFPQSPDVKGTFAVTSAGFGFVIPDLKVDDYKDGNTFKDKFVLVDLSNPERSTPHSKYLPYQSIENKVNWAAINGAKGILFFTNDTLFDLPNFDSTRRSKNFEIPAFFIKRYTLVDSIFRFGLIDVNIKLNRETRTGHNVIAFLDNGAPYTVVIGAHYDHLGYGELGGSLHKGAKAIHNGADDNASGTVGLMILAEYFSKAKYKDANFLFVAFSGEELGLLGSGFMVKNLPIEVSKISYMLNMDMIGRLNLDLPYLGINGIGTSPSFKSIIDTTQQKPFKIKTTDSGIGSSDHTSFYLANIPALHFFTGTHQDYHKPTDDAKTLNYPGMQDVLNYMIQFIEKMPKEKVLFTKTNDEQRPSNRMKVTMGVVPDYFYEGKGMRLDGVSEGKPAALAGLQKDDIIIRIDNFEISDVKAYMAALSSLKPKASVKVLIERQGKQVLITVNL